MKMRMKAVFTYGIALDLLSFPSSEKWLISTSQARHNRQRRVVVGSSRCGFPSSQGVKLASC